MRAAALGPYPFLMTRKLIALLAGLIIFIGIPLLTWGPGHTGAFFQHPARLAYVVITLIAQVLAVMFVPDAGISQSEGKNTVARQRIAVLLLQLLSVGIIAVAPYADGHGWLVFSGEIARYVGLVCYALGIVLMNLAVVWLGRHFSIQVTIQNDHELVTTGPYRLVRHPRYTGILLGFGGIALIFTSVAALIMLGLLFLTMLWRVADEEVLMAQAFPNAWPAYARTTKRLIPWIY